MSKLRILADGKSSSAKANARGKLFECLMSEVLRHHGYEIDAIPNTNYAGMEIDIEGKLRMVDVPLYAECKCYENDVDCPKFQAFIGKYMTRWMKASQSHGLFIALPGLNSHAKAFYKENYEGKTNPLIKVLDESHVMDAIFKTQLACRPEVVEKAITATIGTAGDNLLLYTDQGYFWIQFVIPAGSGVASAYAMFDANARLITDRTTLDLVRQLHPELSDFTIISMDDYTLAAKLSIAEEEDIVEVRGSSSCFEYQFPAAPEFFVGRESVLTEVSQICSEIGSKTASSRGILFEANSGFGKSSAVLASVAHLAKNGHFALAIDSRSASSSQFIMRVVEHVHKRFGDFNGLVKTESTVGGFEGAANLLLDIGKQLESKQRLLVIFLDQFENVFFLPEALSRIAALILKLCDAKTNVILGFSWKTDLISATKDFPYQQRDILIDASRRIAIGGFSEPETTALLERLREELRVPLRKDLQFLLSEYSQGFPWLLKKLCAHVKAQRESGIQQLEIVDRLLNVEELFQEDLRGLSPEEEDTLRRIAKLAPIGIQDLGDDFKTSVVQTLVHQRVVVRIGSKYDIYWDIFRDYLNKGTVPVQENYILRAQVGTVLKAARLLSHQSPLNLHEFQSRAGLSEKSMYNAARDLKLLGIAKLEADRIELLMTLPKSEPAFDASLRAHLQEKLPRNRLVSRLLEQLSVAEKLSIDEVGELLALWCPYVSATKQTWHLYARVLCMWMNAADLAVVNAKAGVLEAYKPTQLRDRKLITTLRRKGGGFILIQVNPVETVILRLAEAIKSSKPLDRSGLGTTTLTKSLSMLEDFNFIDRANGKITVRQPVIDFAMYPSRRQSLLASAALKLTAFARFVQILNDNNHGKLNLRELGHLLNKELDANWADGTCLTHAKLMLNWARYTGLAPTRYMSDGRRKKEVDDLESVLT